MEINVYLSPFTSAPLLACVEGLKKHGYDPMILPHFVTKPCELSVNWGIFNQKQVKSGKKALILDHGYMLNRDEWTSCSLGSMRGYGNFGNANSPADRWNKHFSHLLKPWRRNYRGDFVVVMGQRAPVSYIDIDKWHVDTIQTLKSAGFEVVFRPHPKAKGYVSFEHLRICKIMRGDFEKNLSRAKWVVTFNSNSGVDSVLAGIPTVTMDKGAVAWPVTNHDPCEKPPMLERKKWCYDLGYTTWNYDELRSGTMWEHLKHAL